MLSMAWTLILPVMVTNHEENLDDHLGQIQVKKKSLDEAKAAAGAIRKHSIQTDEASVPHHHQDTV